MIEKNVVVGPFQCNCRIIICPTTGEGLLVDPGDEPLKILEQIQGIQLPSGKAVQIKYLLHTHAHLDHFGGTRKVKEQLRSPQIVLHREDEPLYQQLKMQGRLFGLEYDDPLPVDLKIEHEQELRVGELKLHVIHTPGHSPGSVCYRLHEDRAQGVRETLFSGDTLFKGSVGRTDLWGASGEDLFKNIKERIFSLDDDTRVCPGHGPDTLVGIEKRENPFFS